MTDNYELLQLLADGLIKTGQVCATAESCTGGLLGAAFSELPGSSDWYAGGIISYSNRVKTELLDVPADLLDKYGAVSAKVAAAMARGALVRLQTDFAVASTGIAGPGGGSPKTPIGTVWLAWARSDGRIVSRLFNFEGDRGQIRAAAVREAISGLLSILRDQGQDPQPLIGRQP